MTLDGMAASFTLCFRLYWRAKEALQDATVSFQIQASPATFVLVLFGSKLGAWFIVGFRVAQIDGFPLFKTKSSEK